MIRYRLRCGDAHTFDGWFRSSAAFDAQRGTSALACPVCGSVDVDRALMAPAIARGAREPAGPQDAPPPADGPAALPAAAPREVAPEEARLRAFAFLHALAARVRETGDDVGDAFPEEARRIHYGEADPRDIYGRATAEEARDLLEEGIGILPLPLPPEERN